MRNLAGNRRCDTFIQKELEAASVELVQHPNSMNREVPASISGRLTLNGQEVFTFQRGWYYWVVSGDVPLSIAQEMFYRSGKVGSEDVRVAGYAGNDKPENWAFPKREVLVDYMKAHNLKSLTYGEEADLCNSGKITAERFVRSYHIDSLRGLILFVNTLRRYGLVDPVPIPPVRNP